MARKGQAQGTTKDEKTHDNPLADERLAETIDLIDKNDHCDYVFEGESLSLMAVV